MSEHQTKETEMLNLKFVEGQPHWRVAVVARFAQLMGVLIHVEGIPFGSNRKRTHRPQDSMGAQGASSGGQIVGASKS